MSTEEQISALFAKANPVPSLDLLDPIDPVDVDHLARRSDRSSEMIDLETPYRVSSSSPNWRWAPAAALAFGVVVFVALAFLAGRPSEVASPLETATQHMTARENLDTEAAMRLFAEDATVAEEGFGLADYNAVWAWYRAIGWDWHSSGCEQSAPPTDRGALVQCSYDFENDMSRAMAHPRVTGEVSILVADGEITNLVSYLDINQFSDVWETFLTWISENHPDDVDTMYVPGGTNPRLDDESIALWAERVDEFAAHN